MKAVKEAFDKGALLVFIEGHCDANCLRVVPKSLYEDTQENPEFYHLDGRHHILVNAIRYWLSYEEYIKMAERVARKTNQRVIEDYLWVL